MYSFSRFTIFSFIWISIFFGLFVTDTWTAGVPGGDIKPWHMVCQYMDVNEGQCVEKCFSAEGRSNRISRSSVESQFATKCQEICRSSDQHQDCQFQFEQERVVCPFTGQRYSPETEAEIVALQSIDDRWVKQTDQANEFCRAGGEEGKKKNESTTKTQCDLILSEQYHVACKDIEDETARTTCINAYHAQCLEFCTDCNDNSARPFTFDDGTRVVDPDYSGPLPDCTFSFGGCRSVNSLLTFGINIAKWLFGIIGALAMLQFVRGGYTMIASFGNPEGFKKGKDILVAAVVGMLIAFGAYLIVDFVLDLLQVRDELRVVLETYIHIG